MADATLTAELLADDPSVVSVGYSRPLSDGRLECTLCPRACRLRDGQRGLCFVRGRVGAQMVLTTWGRSSGFCVDPIEKKPLAHFHPGTPVLSFGTAGCNLTCSFCQNWDISKSRQTDTLADQASPSAIADAAVRSGCRSVAFTYNDPVIFLEYARDVAAACHERNVATVAVTAGYIMPKARADFFAFIDAANVDLKAFSEDFYRSQAGGQLAPVLETLAWLAAETAVWLEVTTLVIPGLNDSDDEIRRQADWMCAHLGPDVPLHLSAFHPDWKMRDRPATPPATLSRARDLAMQAGLRFVYTGNVHDPAGGSTFCPGCGICVIERDWYALGSWRLDAAGACSACGAAIAGHFDPQPGDWGRRRLPVQIGGGVRH